MDDVFVYNRLGELTEAVKGVGRTMARLDKKLDEQDEAIQKLQAWKSEVKGSIRTMKWITTSCGAIIAFIGVEKLVVFAASLGRIG